jgi:GDP-D-mannose dehydratase
MAKLYGQLDHSERSRRFGSALRSASCSITRAQSTATSVARKITRGPCRLSRPVTRDTLYLRTSMPNATATRARICGKVCGVLQRDRPHDHVLATGAMRSGGEFARLAFAHVDRSIERHAKGIGETGLAARAGSLLRGRSCPPPSPRREPSRLFC